MEPRIADPDFALFEGDLLRVLPEVDDDWVDAVVTSPPYLDARDDVTSPVWPDFANWAREWLLELARVLRPAGSLMLNLGRVHRDGLELRWHDAVLDAAAGAGLLLVDTIIWHKVNGGGGRASPYLIDRHEYVYWLALDPAGVYKGFDEARVPYSPATLARYTRKWKDDGSAVKGKTSRSRLERGRAAHPDGAKAGSVFVSSVGAEKGLDHPTPMAPELAEHLVKLACPPAGIVLDPFLGSGTTAVACRKLGRRCIGIELEPEHCAEAGSRLAQLPLV